jgi:two-component system chemotaxis sensor kinase CheA
VAKAAGENDVADAGSRVKADETKAGFRQDKTALLLFSTGDGTPKAVPLSLVARLEEVDTAKIETSNGRHMIQYRGQLMPLVPFDSTVSLKEQPRKPVLVFSDNTSNMGLVVNEIVDITEEVVNVQMATSGTGIIGSAIIGGRATDVVDIAHFIRGTNKDWFKNHGDEAFGQTSTQGRKVLLVDDSPFFRNMLTPLLKVAGYNVTTLDNPLSALEMRENGEKFDIIVSDIEMPQMNGFEFAQKVREENSRWRDIPMVALTSHATEQDVAHGLDAGFSRYIAKFDRDTLLNTLTETLVANDAASHARVAGGLQ